MAKPPGHNTSGDVITLDLFAKFSEERGDWIGWSRAVKVILQSDGSKRSPDQRRAVKLYTLSIIGAGGSALWGMALKYKESDVIRPYEVVKRINGIVYNPLTQKTISVAM